MPTHPRRDSSVVGKRPPGYVACCARDGAVSREPRVVEEPAAEPDALRHRRIGQIVESIDPEWRPRRGGYRISRIQATPAVASSKYVAADEPERREQDDCEACAHLRIGVCSTHSSSRPSCIERAKRFGGAPPVQVVAVRPT